MFPFIRNILLFLSILLGIICIGVMLPQTPRASKSHLASQEDKNRLLRETPSPRILFIGGSNISMSLNSQVLHDSLKLNPVNTGLSASIGLDYMLDNTLAYVRTGDIIIVCPEYSQFYERLSIGTEDLLRVVMDKSPVSIFELHPAQFSNSLKYLPKYGLSKLKPLEYFDTTNRQQIYARNSFNRFGDMDVHWQLEGSDFETLTILRPESFDVAAILALRDFNYSVKLKGAHMYVTFPVLHHTSFDQDSMQINRIAKHLHDEGFTILGTPSRYRMPDSIMFDTPYHLIQPGINMRTWMLLEDLQAALSRKD